MIKSFPAGRQGFTIIEVVVAFALLLVISGGSVVLVGSFGQGKKVYYEALKLRTNLNEQYSKAIQGTALGQDSPLKFGVCFNLDSYSLFATTSVWSEKIDTYNQSFKLPSGIEFSNFNFSEECEGRAGSAVIFYPITGSIAEPGFVVIKELDTGLEYQISIGQGGLVEIN